MLSFNHGVVLVVSLIWVTRSSGQHENTLGNAPPAGLPSLSAVYEQALESFAAGNWTDSIQHLEFSLQLHRLLRDNARICVRRCDSSKHAAGALFAPPHLRAHGQSLIWGLCLMRCRVNSPSLQQLLPSKETLEEFSRRVPYRYLHFAHAKVNNLQMAVPCAHTFLRRNPTDQEMLRQMEEYSNEYDLEGYLVDLELRPHEIPFVGGVKLVNSGDFSSSVEHLEEALQLYLQEYELCQADCEWISHFSPGNDFCTIITEVYTDMLKCKLKCEEDLMPNVGGHRVENFVATIYHYLQYAYYKLNDGRRAVPCAYSYSLFQPDDPVMKHNLFYYNTYSEEWGLQSDHFKPRTEALEHYNHTVTLKQILTFVGMDDGDILGTEDASSRSPDAEFEGPGDYEEAILADWQQMKGKGDAGDSDI